MYHRTRKALKEIMIFSGLAMLGIALSLIPGEDYWQPVLFPAFLVMMRIWSLRDLRLFYEDDDDRYRRLCDETFYVLKRDQFAHLSALLLARDIPWKWVMWMQEQGIDIQKSCRKYMHAFDSFCHFGDLPGQGITRARPLWFKCMTGPNPAVPRWMSN